MEYLEDLKKLNLPFGKYAIFGSGPLVIRGLRENDDIDVVVKKDLWDELSKKYKPKKVKGAIEHFTITIGKIKIFEDWLPWFKETDKLINEAETIHGFSFVKMQYVLEWKKAFNRDKDKKDIKMIEDYMKDISKGI